METGSRRLLQAHVIVGALLLLLGSIVMAGWWLEVRFLVRILPGYTPMVFNTALCFALAGAVLLVPALPLSGSLRFSTLGAAALIAIGSLVVAEHLLSFRITDEWYAQKNLADDLHVILAQVTEGMHDKDYQRPNYPETWARRHGKGRVFYTSMGHREEVWENRKYQGLLLGALGWVSGRLEADVTPNVEKVTPGFKTLKS